MQASVSRRMAAKAPKTNIIRRVLEEKTYSKKTGNRCIYKTFSFNMSLIDKFSIASRSSAMGLLAVFNEIKQNSVAWINYKNVIYSTNLFFYLRKGAPNIEHLKAM